MTAPRELDTAGGVVVPALVALVAVLGVWLVGVPTTWILAVGGVVVVVVVAAVLVGLEGIGIALLVVAVATSTWNAVQYGPLKLTHAALAGALAALALVAVGREWRVRVPPWVWILGAAIALTALLSMVWPPSAAYFAPRDVADLPVDIAAAIDSPGPDGVVAGGKWLVAAIALPMTMCIAVLARPRLVPLLANAWAIGAAVSAAVAVSDRLGLTRIGFHIVPTDWGGRQVGLSVHPNHLALGLAMTLPLVVWRLARSRHGVGALAWGSAGAVLTAGVVAAGSRAGAAGAVLAVGVTLLVDPRCRRLLPGLAGIAVVGAGLVLATTPSLVASLGEGLRLVGSDGAVASDELRAGLAAQALADFVESPVHGIGLEVVGQGHNIYLQLLASGGIVLAAGYVAAQIGFLRAACTVDDGGGLGRVLAVAGGTFLVIGAAGNQLADVFVAVPFALAAGLWALGGPDQAGRVVVHAPVRSWRDIAS